MLNRAEWQKLIREQERSGKSAGQWCKERGMRPNQFYYWRQRVRGVELPDEGRFIPVGTAEGRVELEVGEKIRVKISSNFDEIALKRLLGVLGC